MAEHTYTFAHAVGAEITIKALDLPGTVIAVRQDFETQSYLVAYWSEGSRKTEWLFAWELA